MIDRRIKSRRFRQSCQQCGFFKRELLGWLTEVVFRSSLEPVHSMAEKNLIGIKSEDLFLGKTALDLNRQQGFLDLAMKGSIGRKKEVARKLHSESRCALDSAAGFNVPVRRPSNPPDIDAPVTIEILVLNRNQGVAQHLRIIVVRRNHSPLQRKRTDDAALPVVKLGDGTGTVVFQLLDLGKIGIDEQQSGGGTHE